MSLLFAHLYMAFCLSTLLFVLAMVRYRDMQDETGFWHYFVALIFAPLFWLTSIWMLIERMIKRATSNE